MIRSIYICILLLASLVAQAQDNNSISIRFEVNALEDSDIDLTKLMFYVSGFELLNDQGSVVYKEQDSYHLIDIEDSLSMDLVMINIPKDYTHLKFSLGIDSLTNVGGAMGGDLDPIHGMYWTWQSGYIGFKMEGISPDCPTRKNRFNFHLGGYQGPYAAFGSRILSINKEKTIVIELDLNSVIREIDLEEQHTIMSPSQASAEMAQQVTQAFNIK